MQIIIDSEGNAAIGKNEDDNGIIFDDDDKGKLFYNSLNAIEPIECRRANGLEFSELFKYYSNTYGRYKAYLMSDDSEIDYETLLIIAGVKQPVRKRCLLRFLPSIGLEPEVPTIKLPVNWGLRSSYPCMKEGKTVDTISLSKETFTIPKGIIFPRPGVLGVIDFSTSLMKDESLICDTFLFIEEMIRMLTEQSDKILEFAVLHRMEYSLYKTIESRIEELTETLSDYKYVDSVIIPILRKKMDAIWYSSFKAAELEEVPKKDNISHNADLLLDY